MESDRPRLLCTRRGPRASGRHFEAWILLPPFHRHKARGPEGLGNSTASHRCMWQVQRSSRSGTAPESQAAANLNWLVMRDHHVVEPSAGDSRLGPCSRGRMDAEWALVQKRPPGPCISPNRPCTCSHIHH